MKENRKKMIGPGPEAEEAICEIIRERPQRPVDLVDVLAQGLRRPREGARLGSVLDEAAIVPDKLVVEDIGISNKRQKQKADGDQVGALHGLAKRRGLFKIWDAQLSKTPYKIRFVILMVRRMFGKYRGGLPK